MKKSEQHDSSLEIIIQEIVKGILMLIKFYHYMKAQKKISKFLCALILCLININANGEDPPIDRDFLQLSNNTWLQLKKIDWEKTEFIYGRGRGDGKKKTIIWSKVYETDDDRCWAYAYFLRLKPGRFAYDLDGDGSKEIGIATYDMGNNMIRRILIFSIKKDKIVFVREQGPYNIATDEPVFN